MDILISGASTGIGRACAVHLAKQGHVVWAGVRSKKSFAELTKLNARGLTPVILDVTDGDSIGKALSCIKKKSGTLHALINNAGIVVGGPIEGLSLAEWRRQFDTNFFGVIALTKACLPLLRESKGRVVNMSSISGRVASPFLSPYAASKFALEAFSDSLRRELGKHGVKVAVIEPGPIRTPIWQKGRAHGLKLKTDFPDEVREIYGPSMDKFLRSMEKAEINSAPVALVIQAVVHAVTARQPQTRYPVGPGIGFLSRAARVLPDTWLDQLMRARS